MQAYDRVSSGCIALHCMCYEETTRGWYHCTQGEWYLSSGTVSGVFMSASHMGMSHMQSERVYFQQSQLRFAMFVCIGAAVHRNQEDAMEIFFTSRGA